MSLRQLIALLVIPQMFIGPLWAQPNVKGQWSGVIPMSIVPVAAANLSDGKVLTWSAYDRFNFDQFGVNGETYTQIFDPSTNLPEADLLIQNTEHDMFCPGINNLPDGRILVAGGSSSSRTSLYNPTTKVWTDVGDMNIPRGYQGSVTLSDGSVFTIGGSWSGTLTEDKDAEIWTPHNGWKNLPGITDDAIIASPLVDPAGIYREDNHVWLWPAPNGKLFHAGPSAEMHWFDVSGNGSFTSAGLRGNDPYAMCGTTVMYDIGKILKAGGSQSYDDGTAASDNAFVIDINTDNAVVTDIPDMNYGRIFHNSVVLPDGRVVVFGGTSLAIVFSDIGFETNNTPEMFDPSLLPNDPWIKMAPMATPRTYHSVAILLQDGRIMVGGGGLCADCLVNHPNVEIFSPPYLFDDAGGLAERPVIEACPEIADYNHPITVKTSCTISSFSLIRFSSATHSTNNEQRRIPVTFQKSKVNTYEVNIPGRNLLPPGYYMLFAINDAGVPSVAKNILIGTYSCQEPQPYCELDKADWTLLPSSSGAQSSFYGGGEAFDDDPDSYYHSPFSGTPSHPHNIDINLGSSHEIRGFTYLPRPPATGVNGTISSYNFYASTDGVNWGVPLCSGVFGTSTGLKEILLDAPTTAQYIRLVSNSEVNGNDWTSIAEIGLFVSDCNAGIVNTNPPGLCPVDQSAWSVQFVDSEEAGDEASNAFDNDPQSIWHSQWASAQPPHPHEIQIDLGASHDIEAFQYLPRPASSGQNGNIANYEFYISTDGLNWGTAVSTGTFSSGSSLKTRTFTAKTGRYIRLVALSEINGTGPFTSVAELDVFTANCSGSQNPQSITFNTVPNQSTLQRTFDLTATASSGLPVTYTIISGPAVVEGSTICLNGLPGKVIVRADQAGNGQWSAAPSVTQTFFIEDSNCPPIDFTNSTIFSYTGSQDNGSAELCHGGSTVALSEVAFKYVDFSYTLTTNSYLAFEFISEREGDYFAIGMDNDNSWDESKTFKLFGTQSLSNDIESADPYTLGGYKQYVLPIGEFYTGSMDRIFFIADHGTAPSYGVSNFRNIRVYEDGACPGTQSTRIKLKVNLQGPWQTTEMSTTLSINGMLPKLHPYDGGNWNYDGEECLEEFPPDCVDWVLLSIRDPNDATKILFQRACLLRKDGQLIDTDGSEEIEFGITGLGAAYISVDHRNHLGVMTLDPISLD